MGKTRYNIIICAIIVTAFSALISNRITAQSISEPLHIDTIIDITLSDSIAIIEGNDTIQTDSIQNRKNLRFSILGGPGYTPDYGFLIGGSALMTFSFKGMEEFENRSVLPVAFSLTFGSKVSVSFLVRPQLFFNKDRIRLMGDFIYSNLGSNYYGVGYEHNREVLRSDSTTQYFNSQVKVNPVLLFRLAKSDWFIGPTFHLQYDKVSEPSAGVIADPYYLAAGGTDTGFSTLNNGLGFAVSYDTRDIPANAYSGINVDFKAIAYSKFLLGDYNYQLIQLKYRQYIQLSKNTTGRTLAWTFASENIFGDAPFTRLPLLGSPFDLRGYYQGQYRDKSTHLVMVEYRHKFHVEPVNFWSKLANRLGFATWVGSGFMGPTPFDIEGVLPNFGAGIRIEVQPRMNFRIDAGYSPIDRQTLVYFNMTEAF